MDINDILVEQGYLTEAVNERIVIGDYKTLFNLIKKDKSIKEEPKREDGIGTFNVGLPGAIGIEMRWFGVDGSMHYTKFQATMGYGRGKKIDVVIEIIKDRKVIG